MSDPGDTAGEICLNQCLDKECGDDGCGGSCGECPDDAPLCQAGKCLAGCAPACEDKECGGDGCGGSCGTCGRLTTCNDGQCVDECVPDCQGKACGEEGCGVSCGECDDGLACTDQLCDQGICGYAIQTVFCVIAGVCVPSSAEDPENACAKCLPATTQKDWTLVEDGAACGAGKVCYQGVCCDAEGNCEGKECGDDGCGGTCGECAEAQEDCVDGLCICQPHCVGKECGDDGCGGTCGECAEDEECDGGTCVMTGELVAYYPFDCFKPKDLVDESSFENHGETFGMFM